MRRARHMLVVALGLVLVLGSCGGSSPTAGSGPTDADRRYVAVLARHVRHQGELASAATARLSGRDAGQDGGVGAVVAAVGARADALADELDAVLQGWGVDGPAESALFAGAVGQGSVAPGTIVYGCSLAGPLDDVARVQQAEAALVPLRFSQLAMTAAVEGRALAATDGAATGGESRRRGADVDAFERDLLRAVAPWLPATDRGYARSGGEPDGP